MIIKSNWINKRFNLIIISQFQWIIESNFINSLKNTQISSKCIIIKSNWINKRLNSIIIRQIQWIIQSNTTKTLPKINSNK